jgi:hypothetical protein
MDSRDYEAWRQSNFYTRNFSGEKKRKNWQRFSLFCFLASLACGVSELLSFGIPAIVANGWAQLLLGGSVGFGLMGLRANFIAAIDRKTWWFRLSVGLIVMMAADFLTLSYGLLALFNVVSAPINVFTMLIAGGSAFIVSLAFTHICSRHVRKLEATHFSVEQTPLSSHSRNKSLLEIRDPSPDELFPSPPISPTHLRTYIRAHQQTLERLQGRLNQLTGLSETSQPTQNEITFIKSEIVNFLEEIGVLLTESSREGAQDFYKNLKVSVDQTAARFNKQLDDWLEPLEKVGCAVRFFGCCLNLSLTSQQKILKQALISSRLKNYEAMQHQPILSLPTVVEDERRFHRPLPEKLNTNHP